MCVVCVYLYSSHSVRRVSQEPIIIIVIVIVSLAPCCAFSSWHGPSLRLSLFYGLFVAYLCVCYFLHNHRHHHHHHHHHFFFSACPLSSSSSSSSSHHRHHPSPPASFCSHVRIHSCALRGIERHVVQPLLLADGHSQYQFHPSLLSLSAAAAPD